MLLEPNGMKIYDGGGILQKAIHDNTRSESTKRYFSGRNHPTPQGGNDRA